MKGFFIFDESDFANGIIILAWVIGIVIALIIGLFVYSSFLKKYFRENYKLYVFLFFFTALIAQIFYYLIIAILDSFRIFTILSLIKNLILICGISVLLIFLIGLIFGKKDQKTKDPLNNKKNVVE